MNHAPGETCFEHSELEIGKAFILHAWASAGSAVCNLFYCGGCMKADTGTR